MKLYKTIFSTTIICIAIIATTSNCKKENKETVYGNTCDSTNVSYKNTIAPILSNTCYSCHSTANAGSIGGGTILDNYAEIMNYVDTADINNSSLYTDVMGSNPKMPKTGTKLSTCDVAKIKNWILAGAKNN